MEKPKTSWVNTGKKKKQEDSDKHSSYFSTHPILVLILDQTVSATWRVEREIC